MASTTNSTSAAPCAIWNGGSDCVGASALRAAIFWNDCTISTNTLNHSATIAVTT